MRDWKARLILSGPKGSAHAELEVPITDVGLQAALAMVKLLYESLSEPEVANHEAQAQT